MKFLTQNYLFSALIRINSLQTTYSEASPTQPQKIKTTHNYKLWQKVQTPDLHILP